MDATAAASAVLRRLITVSPSALAGEEGGGKGGGKLASQKLASQKVDFQNFAIKPAATLHKPAQLFAFQIRDYHNISRSFFRTITFPILSDFYNLYAFHTLPAQEAGRRRVCVGGGKGRTREGGGGGVQQ